MSNPTEEQSLPPVNDAVVITLKKPVRYGDQLLTFLELREPTAGDLRRLSDLMECLANPFRMALALAAAVTGIPDKVLDRLSLEDIGEVAKYLNPFVVASLSMSES